MKNLRGAWIEVRGVVAALLLAALAVPSPGWTRVWAGTPEAIGDQLFFFYDATSPRLAFLNVANPSSVPVDLEVSFYPAGGSRLESRFALGAWANRVVNPTDVAGVDGTFGLAVVTPVKGPASAQPMVPQAPLAGSFTQANTSAGAAFGDNAIGRLAVDASDERAAPGSDVDGSAVRYERLAPPALAVPTYYDPQTLDPPENDGNRILLFAFEDSYGSRWEPRAPSGSLSFALLDASGAEVVRGDRAAALVLATSLQELAGQTALAKSGKAFFQWDRAGTGNLFGFFLQSLEAFGAGQRMPSVGAFPAAQG